jgi:hypothetical protein
LLLEVEVEDHTLEVAVVLVDLNYMEVQLVAKQQTEQHFQLLLQIIQ